MSFVVAYSKIVDRRMNLLEKNGNHKVSSGKQHNLYSKGELASLLQVTTQTFANWQARYEDFPGPTYSNRAGNVALYSTEDVEKIFDYVTRAERDRLAEREKTLRAVLSGE